VLTFPVVMIYFSVSVSVSYCFEKAELVDEGGYCFFLVVMGTGFWRRSAVRELLILCCELHSKSILLNFSLMLKSGSIRITSSPLKDSCLAASRYESRDSP
jgi:hypothetical protein